MLHLKCLRCGRTLKVEKSQKQGYGDSCFKKMKSDKFRQTLFKEFMVM